VETEVKVIVNQSISQSTMSRLSAVNETKTKQGRRTEE